MSRFNFKLKRSIAETFNIRFKVIIRCLPLFSRTVSQIYLNCLSKSQQGVIQITGTPKLRDVIFGRTRRTTPKFFFQDEFLVFLLRRFGRCRLFLVNNQVRILFDILGGNLLDKVNCFANYIILIFL
jgi:hypothetical protein